MIKLEIILKNPLSTHKTAPADSGFHVAIGSNWRQHAPYVLPLPYPSTSLRTVSKQSSGREKKPRWRLKSEV